MAAIIHTTKCKIKWWNLSLYMSFCTVKKIIHLASTFSWICFLTAYIEEKVKRKMRMDNRQLVWSWSGAAGTEVVPWNEWAKGKSNES